MAERITFECPECSAKLSVTDRSKLGKKIRCPKCKEIFTPEVPEDDFEDAEIDQSNIFDDDSDDDEMDKPARGRNQGGGSKPSGRKSSKPVGSSGNSKTILIAGAAVGVLVLIGIGVAISGVLGGKDNTPTIADLASASTPAPAAPSTPVTATSGATQTAAAVPAPAASSAPVTTAPAPTAPPATVPVTTAQVGSSVSMTPAERVLGLRWMPSDTEMILHVKISELWAAPLLKPLISQPQFKASMDIFQQSGLVPEDVESVTVGFSDLTESMEFGMALGAGAVPNPAVQPSQRMIGVIRTKKAPDWKQVFTSAPGLTAKEQNGKSYYEAPSHPAMPSIICWSAPEPKTLIFGTTKDFLAALDRGESVIPRKEFTSINHLPHLVLALAFPKLDSNPKFARLETNPIFNQARATISPYAIQAGTIGLSIKGGFDLQIAVTSNTDEGSKKLKTDMESGLAMLRGLLEMSKATSPPLIAELGDQVLKNARLDEKSRVVKLSTNLPDSAQAKLEQLPPILMIMAMTGAMGGSSGQPGQDGILASAKQPGETPSVPSKSAEGSLEGMELTAKAAWSNVTTVSSAGVPSVGMEIIVDVTSPEIEKIAAAAGIFATTMSLHGGGSLQKTKSGITESSLAEMTLTPFDGAEEFSFDHPPKTLRLRLPVEAPAPESRIVDVLEGSFKILVAEESHSVVIEDAPKAVRRPMKGTPYDETELKLRRSHSSIKPEWLTLTCAKEHYIGKIEGTPGNYSIVTPSDKDQISHQLISGHTGGQFPDDFKLEFKISSNVKEHVVTFRFENVVLPGIETRPTPTVTVAPTTAAAAAVGAGDPAEMAQKPAGATTAPTAPAAAANPGGFKFRIKKDDDD